MLWKYKWWKEKRKRLKKLYNWLLKDHVMTYQKRDNKHNQRPKSPKENTQVLYFPNIIMIEPTKRHMKHVVDLRCDFPMKSSHHLVFQSSLIWLAGKEKCYKATALQSKEKGLSRNYFGSAIRPNNCDPENATIQ